ncbi:MAG: 50S ribosomal protein L25 [Anaerolineales bacterium]|nr:50S ribosomal protein L25 [Anaerolineales bacterium]
MSDRVTIEANLRSVTEKTAKKLRREGWVPGVIYGRTDPVHVEMEAIALRRALRIVGTTQLADVMFNGQQRTVLVREIQQHATRGDLIHIDFYEVDLASTITSEAELVRVGVSKPTQEGIGTPVLVVRTVEIECRPDALISEIEVDMSQIQTPDDVLTVADLKVPDGVTIVTDPEVVITSFEYTRIEAEEEEEEGFAPAADDVEVIGRGRHDEDDFED